MDENKPHLPAARSSSTPAYCVWLILGLAWVVTLSAIMAGTVPLLLTPFLILFVISASLYLLLSMQETLSLTLVQERLHLPDSPLALALLGFAAYIALSSFWSLDMKTALSKAVLMVAILMGCYFCLYIIKKMNRLQRHRFTRGILVGTCIALFFPLVELLSDLAILNFLSDRFPHLIKGVGPSKFVPAYYLNRNVTVLSLFIWPALLVAFFWKGPIDRRYLYTALVGSLLLVTFLSESETAKVAVILGLIVFMAAVYRPQLVSTLAKILWVIAVVGAVPLMLALHKTGLQEAEWLAISARDRIHIWNYTAQRVAQNPVLGIGIRSSRSYKRKPQPALSHPRPFKLKDHPGWHSHNIFLQTWYELGAVGAAFLLAIGLFMLHAIQSLKREVKPFVYGAFASFSMIAAFGYGIWQSWLLASFGWTAIFFLLVFTYEEENSAKAATE